MNIRILVLCSVIFGALNLNAKVKVYCVEKHVECIDRIGHSNDLDDCLLKSKNNLALAKSIYFDFEECSSGAQTRDDILVNCRIALNTEKEVIEQVDQCLK